MNSDTTKDHLKTILLTDYEPFREYWNMWGQPKIRDIYLSDIDVENDWPTFEAMVTHFRKDIEAKSAKDLFSRFWKRKSGEFTQRAFNVILCGGVHSVVVFELNDKVVYTKWYGWTPSYFADYPNTETDLALKAVWEGDLEQLMKLGEEGYKLTGGFNSMTLMKAIWENNFEIVEYLVNHKATRDEVDARDSAVLKALADIKGNKKIIGIVSSL